MYMKPRRASTPLWVSADQNLHNPDSRGDVSDPFQTGVNHVGSDQYSRRRFLKTLLRPVRPCRGHLESAGTDNPSPPQRRSHVGLIGRPEGRLTGTSRTQKTAGLRHHRPVCDVWQERLDSTIAKCEGAKPYHDYRAHLPATKNVDPMLIASPALARAAGHPRLRSWQRLYVEKKR